MIRPPYKILIVDDDKSFLAMMTSTLESLKSNLEIETARSGMEALHIVKHFVPDLVLLDIALHEMNGLVTFRFIKAMCPSTLIYFLSGYSREDMQNAMAMVHADGYFTKPQFSEILHNGISIKELISFGRRESVPNIPQFS